MLGSTKRRIIKDKNSENDFHLEFTEVILFHCNFVNNSYKENLKVLFTFVPNKSFGPLLKVSQNLLYFWRCVIQSCLILKFTDQNF